MAMIIPINANKVEEPVNETHMGLLQYNKVIDLDGKASSKPLTYLDSTATALAHLLIQDEMRSFLEEGYANTHTIGHHRGRDSTEAVNAARKSVGKFVGYDPDEDLVIFNGAGATGPLNYLSHVLFPDRLSFLNKPSLSDDIKNEVLGAYSEKEQRIGKEIMEKPYVITSEVEHHSNQTVWFDKNMMYIPVDEKTGQLNIDVLKEQLEEHKDQVRLVTVSGASNITGIMNPIYDIAKMAHEAGAEMCVDAAQLAPHHEIQKRREDPNENIDYIALSPHKFGVPGTPGVLVANRSMLDGRRNLVATGGGVVSAVTINPAEFTPIEELAAGEEPGTPNVPGIISVGLAAEHLTRNMSKLAKHEKELTGDLISKLQKIGNDDIEIVGLPDPEKRVGVVSFSVKDVPHEIVTSYLNDSWNIAVRNGCFCAHPLVTKMAGVSDEEIERIKSGDRANMPGYIRASFGEHNTKRDVNTLVEALTELVHNKEKVVGLYDIDKEGNAIRKDGLSQSKGWSYEDAVERIAHSEQLYSLGFNRKEALGVLPVFQGGEGSELLSRVEKHANSKRIIQKVNEEVGKRDNLTDEEKVSVSRDVLLDIYNPEVMETKGPNTARAKNRPVYLSANSKQITAAFGWENSIKSLVEQSCPSLGERIAI